jgi:hypothetical protein
MPGKAHVRAALSAAAILVVAACDADRTTPTILEPQYSSSGPVLVECPSSESASAEGTLGATGGSITLKNHRLSLPLQAVTSPTKFRLSENPSKYMELDLRAGDQASFGFNKPVSITIDYSRCTRSNIDKGPLSVWKIDPATKALLKQMNAVDDKTGRTITFASDSLSTYSIAN